MVAGRCTAYDAGARLRLIRRHPQFAFPERIEWVLPRSIYANEDIHGLDSIEALESGMADGPSQ